MDRQRPLAPIVARLAREFPDSARAEVEQVVAGAWALFATSQEPQVREAVTEWYARRQLREAVADRHLRLARPGEGTGQST